jgi:hypothetical protein
MYTDVKYISPTCKQSITVLYAIKSEHDRQAHNLTFETAKEMRYNHKHYLDVLTPFSKQTDIQTKLTYTRTSVT